MTVLVTTSSVYCLSCPCWAQGVQRGEGDPCPQETLLCDPGHDSELSGCQCSRPRHADGKSDSATVVGSDQTLHDETQASGHLARGHFCPGPSPAISRLLIVTSGHTAVCVEGTAGLTLLGLASGLQRGKLELRETQVMRPKAMRWGWGSIQTAAGLVLSPGVRPRPPLCGPATGGSPSGGWTVRCLMSPPPLPCQPLEHWTHPGVW